MWRYCSHDVLYRAGGGEAKSVSDVTINDYGKIRTVDAVDYKLLSYANGDFLFFFHGYGRIRRVAVINYEFL